MKDFELDDIVDEVIKEFGLTSSKTVIRRILRHHLRKIIKVMGTKRHRVLMRECDLHTIYTNPDIFEMMGKVADVDETKVFQNEDGFAIDNEKWKNPLKSQKINAAKSYKATEYLPKLYA
jgi:hypothetical protein